MKSFGSIGLALLLLASFSVSTIAQESDGSQKISPALKKVIGRLEQVEQELEALKARTTDLQEANGKIPVDPEKRQLYLQLEEPFLGTMYERGNQRTKFFAAKLTCLNLTEKEVVLNQENLTLEYENASFKVESNPKKLRLPPIQSESGAYQIQNKPLLKKMSILPGRSSSTWLLFTKLPLSEDTPRMMLYVNHKEEPRTEISINELSRERIKLKVERIGPRQSLGLLTIDGILDSLSIGELVSQVNQLVKLRVARFVIRFGETGSMPDSSVKSWLTRQAQNSGSGQPAQMSNYPSFSNSIRELHLAKLPQKSSRSTSSRTAQLNSRIHSTAEVAVEAALKSVYENLNRSELIKEIQSENMLTKIVALKHGSSRLLDDQLPLLIKLADDDDPQMQNAALYALRHFNNAAAFDKLEEYVRKNIEGVSESAIDSLASSRFGEAHQRLLSVLNNEPPGSKLEIINVLAENPRPIWGETIYQFLTEESDDEYTVKAMTALNRIGHPQLLEVLRSALAKDDFKLKQAAFTILVGRDDEESEKIAIDYTLKYIEDKYPTPEMHKLLMSTKSQAAIPLLLKKLDKSGNDRRSILKTLAAIGDQRVVSRLVDIYPKLSATEKSIALEALWEMKSADHQELARQALTSTDHSLIRVAVKTLTEKGTDKAIGILIKAFETNQTRQSLSYLANALSQIKTPEARAVLTKAREVGSRDKKRLASEALRQIWQTSPGHQYVIRASYSAKEEKYEQAVKEFNIAIELDGELPTAYSGRGNAMLKLEKFKEAKADFRKALVYDSLDGMSITGIGLVLVREGDEEGAFEWISSKESHFKENDKTSAYFAYNKACVYGVALTILRTKKTAGEQIDNFEQKENSYTRHALDALKFSTKTGFAEFEWMREDPDLKSLHENKEFREISKWSQG